MRSRQPLKPIRFEGELLPDWAQLLDVAASLSAVPDSTRQWFALFASRTGTADARTVREHCRILRAGLLARRESVLTALSPGSEDSTPTQIHAAWLYSLETMIEQTADVKTCVWQIQGSGDAAGGLEAGGDITLRRV